MGPMHRFLPFRLLTVGLLTALLAGCSNVVPKEMETRIRDRLEATRERERMMKEVAVVRTDKGTFVIQFFGEETPNSVLHVRSLIHDKFYDGIRVHRSVRNPVPFIVQLGDPVTKGRPGEDFIWDGDQGDKPVAGFNAGSVLIPVEASKRKHERGKVALARRPSTPESGSQFYIALAAQPQLDGQATVIGQIIEGMDVVEQLDRGDRIVSIRLEERK
jgi:peptidyl-prolyl cis-trans isomerase B (cyclophilin B)